MAPKADLTFRIAVPGDFDVEPVREQHLKPVAQRFGGRCLLLGKKAGQSPLARSAQRDQTIGATLEIVQSHMRFELQGALQVSLGN